MAIKRTQHGYINVGGSSWIEIIDPYAGHFRAEIALETVRGGRAGQVAVWTNHDAYLEDLRRDPRFWYETVGSTLRARGYDTVIGSIDLVRDADYGSVGVLASVYQIERDETADRKSIGRLAG